jgi:hypothetical protein
VTRFHSRVRRFALALATTAAVGLPAARASGQELEYQVKAAFLLNFARFTEFPAASFDREESPVTICVLGQNPFGDTLEQTVAAERAGGRSVVARTIGDPVEARSCQIVFVPLSETQRTGEVAAAIGDRGIVTVGESSSFLSDGGTINLFVDDGRVRFAMRPQQAERGGVRFSSHLLRLARNHPERQEVPH